MTPAPETKDSQQLPVVDVDQAFPLLTTDVGGRAQAATALTAGNQGPIVEATLRDVLGWRPRTQDTKAFTAALTASFDLKLVEGHVETRYRSRGFSMQADLGAVSGGQASLYARGRAAHAQMVALLDGLTPLRTDADAEDCHAFRTLVRDAITRLVDELGAPGGPRVPVVDAAFTMLTGWRADLQTTSSCQCPPGTHPAGEHSEEYDPVMWRREFQPHLPRRASSDPDTIPGQLGALRERFGLTDVQVNTVEEEGVRTAFWTLVDLVVDLQRSWESRRASFMLGAGSGFLGTELVLISRLLHAAAEQVDELEAVLDSVLVSAGERQTLVLDEDSGLTLSGLLDWMRVFLAEDGPRIARDTGRDGMLTAFTPTAAALQHTLHRTLVCAILPDRNGSDDCCAVSWLPMGCCASLPAGMYSARVRIAVSSLCRLLERLTAAAARIGRYPGAILFDVVLSRFAGAIEGYAGAGSEVVRVSVRGLNLQPQFVPAFVNLGSSAPFRLALEGSTTTANDTLVGLFTLDDLPDDLQALLLGSSGPVLAPAEGIPLAVIDGETGRVVTAPAPATWPDRVPADRPLYDVAGSPRKGVNVDRPEDWPQIARELTTDLAQFASGPRPSVYGTFVDSLAPLVGQDTDEPAGAAPDAAPPAAKAKDVVGKVAKDVPAADVPAADVPDAEAQEAENDE